MLLSILVIAQKQSYSDSILGDITSFLETIPGVFFHSFVNLSPSKAIDFIVQLKEDDDHLEEQLKVVASVKQQVKEFNKTYNETHELPIDIIVQIEDELRKDKKLFVFDMDSTLIKQEVIELIAKYAQVEDKVAQITESAMRGEIDFNESLQQRVSLLRGIESSELWDNLKKQIVITPGAKELTKGLKKKGVKMAVLSGGFLPLANYIKETLGLDYAYANNLETEVSDDSKEILKGTTYGKVINGDVKAELLSEIAQKHGIDPKYAVAVGDGANDLKMMKVAGWGVAWNAKPKVRDEAQSALNSGSLKDIFYILGYHDGEIEELLA